MGDTCISLKDTRGLGGWLEDEYIYVWGIISICNVLKKKQLDN